MGILGTILGRREPVIEYRTVDGGHPAPYPDMTDEQLYNYELAFNVPNRTFDKPPVSVAAAKREPEGQQYAKPIDTPVPASFSAHPVEDKPVAEPVIEPVAEEQHGKAPDTFSSFGHTAKNEAKVQENIAQPSEVKPLDFSRPVRTVTTKQPVEIITTRARHPIYKVHGYIDDDDVVTVFTLDGRLSENGPRFLENVPEKQQLHLNVYVNCDPHSKDRYVLTQHESRDEADSLATASRVACIRLEFDL